MPVDDTPYLNREIRRKVERYARKHNLKFMEAYNKLYKTKYSVHCFDKPLDTESQLFHVHSRKDISTNVTVIKENSYGNLNA